MSSFTRGVNNVDDLLSSTLDKYRNDLFEQWMKGNAITKKLFEAGSVREIDGGNDIVEHINYQAGGTAAWTAKNGTVSVTPLQQFTDARYKMVMLMGSVALYDWEEAQNAGNPKMFDLLDERMANLKEEMNQSFQTAALASSTPNTNTLWSLIDIIDSSNPSLGNYGDIDRSSYAFWQSDEVGSGSMATQGLEDIRTAFNFTSREGMDPITFLVTTQTVYEGYNARLTIHEQLHSGDKGDLEFTHLEFMGKPMFFSDVMPTGNLLGINTKHLKLCVNKNMKFKNQPFVRQQGGINKAAIVQLMCQLVATRPASMFKLTGLTA